MTDDRTKQLLDDKRLFLELQRLIIDEYKIEQRILQEDEHGEAPDEGKEFAKLRLMIRNEKDLKKLIRDSLVLQESSARAVAYLLAKNNARLIALMSEKLEMGK